MRSAPASPAVTDGAAAAFSLIQVISVNPQRMTTNRGPSRFTLIELLVVVTIIAILAAMLLPALNSAKDKGKQILCLSNTKQFGSSMHMYGSDNEGYFTVGNSEWDLFGAGWANACSSNAANNEWRGEGYDLWTWALQPYYVDYALGVCPSDSDPRCMAKCAGAVGSTQHTFRIWFKKRFGTDADIPSDGFPEAAAKWPWSIAVNYHLAPVSTCNFGSHGAKSFGRVASPSACILFTEMGTMTQYGWPNGSSGEPWLYYGYYGEECWRTSRFHSDGRNFVFVDGHGAYVRELSYSTVPLEVQTAYETAGIYIWPDML